MSGRPRIYRPKAVHENLNNLGPFFYTVRTVYNQKLILKGLRHETNFDIFPN